MKRSQRLRIGRITSVAILCVVVTEPPHRVYGMDVNRLVSKAQQGSVQEQLALGQAYLLGHGVPKDDVHAAYWYEKAAGSGNPEAQNLMGYLYESGVGVAPDMQRALRWYQLAAASGSPDAMVNLGVLNLIGLGTKKDPQRASDYFRDAVRHGSGTAAAYLGTIAWQGESGPRNPSEAERWFREGQKLHDPISIYDLGLLYATVPGHAHDLGKAVRCLREAAGMGHAPAMEALAGTLLAHPELSKGTGEAINLLQAAENSGSWRASLTLASLAHVGTAMPQDDQASYLHLQIALLQGGSATQGFVASHPQLAVASAEGEEARTLQAQAAAWYQQHSQTPALVTLKGHRQKFFSDPAAGSGLPVMDAELPKPDTAS